MWPALNLQLSFWFRCPICPSVCCYHVQLRKSLLPRALKQPHAFWAAGIWLPNSQENDTVL